MIAPPLCLPSPDFLVAGDYECLLCEEFCCRESDSLIIQNLDSSGMRLCAPCFSPLAVVCTIREGIYQSPALAPCPRQAILPTLKVDQILLAIRCSQFGILGLLAVGKLKQV